MNISLFLISNLCLLTAFVGMQQPIMAAKHQKDSSSSSHHHKKKKCCKKILDRLNKIDNTELPALIKSLATGCGPCKTINKCDFKKNSQLSKTYVISKPGNYCLAEDIAFNPSYAGSAAIQISSNDVCLNLCCNVLSQNPTNTTANTKGIQIGDPTGVNKYKNIKIYNGTVSDFTTAGIVVQQGSTILRLQDLNILRNGGNGGVSVIQMFDKPVSGGLMLLGTNAQPVSDVIIDNCNCLDNDSKSQTLIYSVGMLLNQIAQVQVTNSTFSGTRGLLSASGVHGWGYTDVTFNGCSFTNSIGSQGAYGHGINASYGLSQDPLTINRNTTFENCISSNHTGTAFNCTEVAGIEIEVHDGGVIRNCIIENLTSNATVFEPGNPVLSSATVCAGINASTSCSNILLENNYISNLSGSSTTVGCLAVENSSRVIYRNVAVQNVINTFGDIPEGALAAGFWADLVVNPGDGFDNIWENCVAQGVTGPIISILPSAGLIMGGQTNAVVSNCIFKNNDRGIHVTASLFDSAVITNNALIENTIVEGNTFDGILDTVGSAGNNTYIANKAIFNGVAGSGSLNYTIPFGQQILNWHAASVPDLATTDLQPRPNGPSVIDNISRLTP